jgi:hypothetical protein
MHVEIHAMQSDQLVMRNTHHVQQSTPSAVVHQLVKTPDRVHHDLINTDLVVHRLKVVKQCVSC